VGSINPEWGVSLAGINIAQVSSRLVLLFLAVCNCLLYFWFMSRKYKFKDPDAAYFVTFATINWIDVFTRRIYKDIIVDSLNFCIKEKEVVKCCSGTII
jgi:hypothetical protein